jgi:hypothetical protein
MGPAAIAALEARMAGGDGLTPPPPAPAAAPAQGLLF